MGNPNENRCLIHGKPMTEYIDESSQERQGSDDDGAWKEALRWHLKEFIELCFRSSQV